MPALILIRYLAGQQVLNWFERVYTTIFGSQIQLLRALEGKPDGMDITEVALYFGSVKAKHSELNDWGLDTHLEYLFSLLLIDADNGTIKLREEGKEFLKILAERDDGRDDGDGGLKI